MDLPNTIYQALAQVPMDERKISGVWLKDEDARSYAMDWTQTLLFNAHQRKAIQTSLSNDFTIIHGSFGTGKTYVVASVAHLACNAGSNVLVTAPQQSGVKSVIERYYTQCSHNEVRPKRCIWITSAKDTFMIKDFLRSALSGVLWETIVMEWTKELAKSSEEAGHTSKDILAAKECFQLPSDLDASALRRLTCARSF